MAITKSPTPKPTRKWIHVLAAAAPIIPWLVQFVQPGWLRSPFTPRQLIYTHDPLPFILAPWTLECTSLAAVFSRAVQVALFWNLPSCAVIYCHLLWIPIALVRTLVGHLLSRSVGWAHPSLFCHWALYETVEGLGPPLVAVLFILSTFDSTKPPPNHPFSEVRIGYVIAGLAFVFALLDRAPWTYGVAVLCGLTLALGYHVMRVARRNPRHPMMLSAHKHASSMSTRAALASFLLSFSLILAPRLVNDWISAPHTLTPMPTSPSLTSPLLEILVLSHPRPNATAASIILSTTIASYLPFLSNNVVLSVFTHSTNHPAFKQARTEYGYTNVQFYADADTHPDAVSGQYLHLAEAFRWATETDSQKAEWIMLVEDDFPFCMGQDGWNVVTRVMTILENSRSEATHIPEKPGGFIGTGGSGLIIHRSLIPVLILLMQTHAELHSKLSPNVARRPADLIIQDCLLGNDPLCPGKQGEVGLVISSRLVMDHIGGMVSTDHRKAHNQDKWRCRWRHPFHGRPEVEVVLV